MTDETHQYTNRLSKERSPYLLQHAHNPVDWYPWGDEAFEKAKSENKLIFLSIGYSTCHWCHVMEKESFEDEKVAALMNRVFVSIKVDREERPDIDSVFMETAMMMNQRGGWPLNLILTPEGKPFYAATYIPKPNFVELISQVETFWKDRQDEVKSSAKKIVQALENSNREASGKIRFEATESNLDLIKDATFSDLEKRYDAENGGFNLQPKFPQPQNLLFLLRRHNSTGNTKILAMVENTLNKMRNGGIYDQAGFGFHRYSTDRDWKLPHFEKMLYDQAMLILAYTETYQLTGNPEYRQTAEEIIEYVLRDMRSPEGGFYSAEDADSEGEEGRFYLWNYGEFVNLLEENKFDGKKYAELLNLHENGNYADEASGRKPGNNILFRNLHTLPDSYQEFKEVRSLLFSVREQRIHPHKDDKILTDWNGLMIFALAKASWSFDSPEYYRTAKKAADFLLGEIKRADGSILHSYREGVSGTLGMIDDYAFFTRGLLELYRAGFDASYLNEAAQLMEYAKAHFEDNENGGFYQSDSVQTDLLLRKKAMIDNAIPSGNSIIFENLIQLFKITGNINYRTSATAILNTLKNELGTYPSAFAMLLSSFDYSGADGREIIVVGEPGDVTELLMEINSHFQPGTVVIVKNAATETALRELAPYTDYYSLPIGKKAAVYICTDFTCKAPVFTVAELHQVLSEKNG